MEVKDESSHLSVDLVPGARSFGIEVAESDVGAEKVNGIADSRGVMDGGSGFEGSSQSGGF